MSFGLKLLAFLPVPIWLYLLFGRGAFWRIQDSETAGLIPTPSRRVAVVVPARNEADSVGFAIASLVKQVTAGPVHIFLVDDHSTDATPEAALVAARMAGAGGMVTLLKAGPLPSGWTGKLWAIAAGVQQAASFEPDYFLFTDADILHAPRNLARLVSRAESGGYDLVSLMVKLHCGTIAEKALIPAFVFFFFMLYPPAWTASLRRATAGAAGGCILIRLEALERIGGVSGIRSELIDDCALARAVKRAGGKIWLGATSASESIRAYSRFAEIGRMISRTAFAQLHHSALLLAAAVAGMFVTYVLPPLLVMAGVPWAGLAWALMALAYLPVLRFYRRSPLWAPLLPAISFFYIGATIHSAVSYWMGRGGEWKGRAQDPRA